MTVVEPGRAPWRRRLHAWWEGIDPPDTQARGAKPGADAASAVAETPRAAASLDRAGKPLWDATRIEVAELMWGQGFLGPDGAAAIPALVAPFNLTKAMSVLDFGAGLGGAARTIHQRFGTWVTGLEASPELVAAAAKRNAAAGLAKQASVDLFDPDNLPLDRKYDCVFAQEAFAFVADKLTLMRNIRNALKVRGQLLFTDYVLTDDADPHSLKPWMDAERQVPVPVPVWALRDILIAAPFEVRVAEDLTGASIPRIQAGLATLEEHVRRHELTPDTCKAVHAEVALWASRLAAFKKGLRLYRFHALRAEVRTTR